MKMFAVLSAFALLMSVGLSAVSNIDPSDLAKQDPGIYMVTGDKIIPVDSSLVEDTGVEAGETAKSMFRAMRFKMPSQKITSKIRGGTASARIAGEATFIFKGRDFNPQDYVLVRMKSDSDKREVVVGENGAMKKKSKIDSSQVVDLEFTKEGDVHVSSVVGLEAGEYGFIVRNSLKAERIYTFGVDTGSRANQ